jgi:rubrerythrin
MSIYLSPKHGINPCLTYCRRCGGDTPELLIVGNAHKHICRNCKAVHVGRLKDGRCHFCGNTDFESSEIDGWKDRFPAQELCEKCKADIAELKKEVELGGVPWKCSKCKSDGVIKHNSPFAIEFRKEHPIAGIDFNGLHCPVCDKE